MTGPIHQIQANCKRASFHREQNKFRRAVVDQPGAFDDAMHDQVVVRG